MPSMGCDMGLPDGGRRHDDVGSLLAQGVQIAPVHREQHGAGRPGTVSGSRNDGAGVIKRGEGGTGVPQGRRESSSLARERIMRIRGRSRALWWNAGLGTATVVCRGATEGRSTRRREVRRQSRTLRSGERRLGCGREGCLVGGQGVRWEMPNVLSRSCGAKRPKQIACGQETVRALRLIRVSTNAAQSQCRQRSVLLQLYAIYVLARLIECRVAR